MRTHVPTVSIVIPAYNHAAWVAEAVASVLQQSFTDWELFIIDDASQDDTWATIHSIPGLQSDQRIQLFHHAQNQGAPATLNEGMALARGKYIAILNSDDVWAPQRLERLLAVAEQGWLDCVATGVTLCDADSRSKESAEPDWMAWYQGLKADFQQQGSFLRTLLRGNFLITTSNFFFRRSVYETLGGFSGLRYVHDYEYILRMCQADLRFDCLWDEALLQYRLHGSNTIREKPLAAIEENMQMLLGQLPLLHAQLNQSCLQGLQIQLNDLYRYTREEWLSTVHYRLVEREQELFGLIADRDAWIAERDAWIAERDSWIDGRDRLIARQEQWLADRDVWVAERDQQIRVLQVAISAQKASLRDQAGLIEVQQRWVSDRDRWIADRDGWIAERDALIRQLQKEQALLLKSRSYRLGAALLAPLRHLRANWLPMWRADHA